MIRNDSESFKKAVDDVTRQLVSAEHRNGMSFVKVPLVYPSGASVVVRVSDSYPDFFVSDFGSIADHFKLELEASGIAYEENQHTTEKIISAAEVVPGDLVLLAAGDQLTKCWG